MSSKSDIDVLRVEIETLKSEVQDLREFVKGLYSMLAEGEEYEPMPNFLGGSEVGRSNT